MTNIVLLSGGIDSTTLLVEFALRFGHANVDALSILYGQRHDREVKAAFEVCHAVGVNHRTLEVAPLRGESSLVNRDVDVPHVSYDDISGVSPTYVPFRNAVLLSYAVSECMASGGGIVAYGAHAEDAAGWAYPDCTPEFAGAMAAAAYIGTYHEVRIEAPFIYMTKAQIIREAIGVGAPLHLTWSCYEGGEEPCGKCATCLARAAAFEAAGVADPALAPMR